MAKQRPANICINVVSSLSHLELLEYDTSKGSFTHLDSEEFMFDPATRELLDDEERFKTMIKRLYERNKIPFKHQTTLVLPSFFTRQFVIPEDVLGEDLKMVLVSEAERFYVFKKIDPEVGYCTIKDGQVLYTAYPKQPLDVLRNCFIELGIPVLSIDCNYTATLRGLVAMGVVQQEVTNQTKWGMMIVSDFNVFMAVIEGSVFEKTLEAPLPLQNVEEEALLTEIKEDFTQFYGYEVLARMVVINNSHKLYSPTLVENLGFQGATDVFDQNDRTLTSRGAQDGPFPCSLEAIGGALVKVLPEVPPMELADVNVLEAMVDNQRKNKIALIMAGIAAIIFGIQFGLTSLIDNFTQGETAKKTKLQAEINQSLNSLAVVPDVKRKLFRKQATFLNYKIANLFVKIDEALPPDAWLTQVEVVSNADFKTLQVTINGETLTSDPLNAYVKELNTQIETPVLNPSVQPQQKKEQRFFSYKLTNVDEKKKPLEMGGAVKK
jgi:hypothetical protein